MRYLGDSHKMFYLDIPKPLLINLDYVLSLVVCSKFNLTTNEETVYYRFLNYFSMSFRSK